jgi:myo-inositol catabolism protein IolC
VSLEGDEQIRIDDVRVHVRKKRVRHVDSLSAASVDHRIQFVNVRAFLDVGIDI